MTSSILQPHFLPGGLLWQMVIVTSFPDERKTTPNDYAPELRELFKALPNDIYQPLRSGMIWHKVSF